MITWPMAIHEKVATLFQTHHLKRDSVGPDMLEESLPTHYVPVLTFLPAMRAQAVMLQTNKSMTFKQLSLNKYLN